MELLCSLAGASFPPCETHEPAVATMAGWCLARGETGSLFVHDACQPLWPWLVGERQEACTPSRLMLHAGAPSSGTGADDLGPPPSRSGSEIPAGTRAKRMPGRGTADPIARSGHTAVPISPPAATRARTPTARRLRALMATSDPRWPPAHRIPAGVVSHCLRLDRTVRSSSDGEERA